MFIYGLGIILCIDQKVSCKLDAIKGIWNTLPFLLIFNGPFHQAAFLPFRYGLCRELVTFIVCQQISIQNLERHRHLLVLYRFHGLIALGLSTLLKQNSKVKNNCSKGQREHGQSGLRLYYFKRFLKILTILHSRIENS